MGMSVVAGHCEAPEDVLVGPPFGEFVTCPAAHAMMKRDAVAPNLLQSCVHVREKPKQKVFRVLQGAQDV